MGPQKGSAFERRICKKLTRWASGRDKPLYYWRTAGSGAQATITKDYDSKMFGDIMPITTEAMWLMDITFWELRDRKAMNVLDFITPSKALTSQTNICLWWEEVIAKADTVVKHCICCFHRHQSRYDYLLCEKDFWDQASNYETDEILVDGYGDVVIIEFDAFLNIVKPWVLASMFLGRGVGKEVKKNYGKQYKKKNRSKSR